MTSTKYNITEEWLRQCYMVDLMKKEDIAAEAGCSKANIDRLLTKWGIRRGKARISAIPAWNRGKNKNNDERMDNAPENLVVLPEDAHIRLHTEMREEMWGWERQRDWLVSNGYEFVKIDEVTA
ncbi:hypothetical protein GCY28_04075 [Salmonella enterica subsp. enterica]|nr:hypothetical protein [Salmonella enterica subsp. enterica]